MHILLVDDDISSVAALKNLLEHEHILKIASNGYEALTHFKQKRYDLVVTDIMMPKMNGIELLKSIRGLDSKINVIVLTGYPTEKHMEDLEKYNASAFFIKPLNVEIFMDTLSNMDISHKNRIE